MNPNYSNCTGKQFTLCTDQCGRTYDTHVLGNQCGATPYLGAPCSCNAYYKKCGYKTQEYGKNLECTYEQAAGNICGTFTQQNDCKAGAINVEFSLKENKIQKQKIADEAILTLKKNTIWSDITKEDLFNVPTPEQYKQYFANLSGSALTLSQQKLLLDQITTDFTYENALNVFINSRNLICGRIDNPLIINTELLKTIIKETMTNVVTNITLSYQYQQSFLKFNYAEAYQSMYYASSLYLYKYKWYIISYVTNAYNKQQE